MERWARAKNIERFQRQLESEKDPQRRRQLEELIARERARLEEIGRERRGSDGG